MYLHVTQYSDRRMVRSDHSVVEDQKEPEARVPVDLKNLKSCFEERHAVPQLEFALGRVPAGEEAERRLSL